MNNFEIKKDEKPFLNFLLIILKWKKFVIINLLIITVISTVIAFMLPKYYYSGASVLPPKEETSMLSASGFSGLTSIMKEFSSIKGMGSLGNRNTYNYLVVLNSRDVFENVVRKFDIINSYGISGNSMEKAIKALSDNVKFEIQEEGNLEIGVYDQDPQKAADMANYFVQLLSEKSYEMSVTEISSGRIFLEKRVQDNMDSLMIAENKLKDYQEKSGIYTIPDQTQSMIGAASKLFAEKALKEIQVDYLQNYLSTDNSMLKAARMELDALNKHINQLPNLGLEYLRLYREVYIRTKILEFIRPMLEQAIFNEKKNVPVVVVVDYAKPAEYKAKPKRLIVIGSAITACLMLTILYIFSVEKWRKFKNENEEDYNRLRTAFRNK